MVDENNALVAEEEMPALEMRLELRMAHWSWCYMGTVQELY